MNSFLLRIGTRGSPLALRQAELVKDQLLHHHPQLNIIIVPITTTGDKITDRTLIEIGGKGLFTKEIELALQQGHIDIAIHSMKDVPSYIPEGLVIDCVLQREDARDAFISIHASTWQALPQGARIGTSSLRRQAQILALRPDCTVIPFRGNVATRIKKLQSGEADATFLAVAGLNRLQMQDQITQIMQVTVMLPAVAQGAIGVERRIKDEYLKALLDPLHHRSTWYSIQAERAFLVELEGSCRTPIAAYAVEEKGNIKLFGLIASDNGAEIWKGSIEGKVGEAEYLGSKLAQRLKKR